jgi:hypothetical protein
MAENVNPASDIELARILADPVLWGESYLFNRDGARREYWPHQIEDLRCEDRNIIHQDGRACGKSVNLVTDILHYAFTTKNGSGLVAAPHQGHLDTLIDELEFQLNANPDLWASVAKNRSGNQKIVRRPYFKIEFTSGTLIQFHPAGSEGKSFRSLHVDRLWVDEGAWLPKAAWNALRQCLNAGGRFRVYSTPNGVRKAPYHRLTTKAKGWKVFRWPSWLNPNWSTEREVELLEFYGGKETPGWQHEVAGEHGAPSHGAFNLTQFLGSLTEIPEYQLTTLTGEDFADCQSEADRRDRIEMLLNLPPSSGTYWLGGDLGYTNDPTELVLFEDEGDVLRLVLRIHAEHVAYPIITEIIAAVDRAYHPEGIGVDKGGNGLSVVQELTGLDKFDGHNFSNRLYGFDFGGTTIIGYDNGEPLKRRTKEYMTTLIGKALTKDMIKFPADDNEIADQFVTHSYVRGERHVIYSKGNDHIIDAVRCALLAKEMERLDLINPTVEEVYLEVLITDPIFK